MGKISVDGEMPLEGIFKETKHICRPTTCQDCLMGLDEHIPWCSYYHRRSSPSSKPEWCKVISIVVSEDI
jgi:hypothetical protein